MDARSNALSDAGSDAGRNTGDDVSSSISSDAGNTEQGAGSEADTDSDTRAGHGAARSASHSAIRSLVRGAWPVAAAATLGSLATVKGVRSRWYRSLEQPAIQPPPPVFRWVWSGLYTAVAGVSVALERRNPDVGFHTALLRNMTLNAAWTWLFFRGHSTRGGLVVAATLAADSVSLARRVSRVSRAAGAAIALYAAWTCFAVVLNGAVIARNPKDRSPLEKHWGC
jgi:Tryptophan-rich sensory protein (mitochondrial benzodiazepine receptor homolog)